MNVPEIKAGGMPHLPSSSICKVLSIAVATIVALGICLAKDVSLKMLMTTPWAAIPAALIVVIAAAFLIQARPEFKSVDNREPDPTKESLPTVQEIKSEIRSLTTDLEALTLKNAMNPFESFNKEFMELFYTKAHLLELLSKSQSL